MQFFDVNAFIGRPMNYQFGAVKTVEEYFQAVEGTGITGLLIVCHSTRRSPHAICHAMPLQRNQRFHQLTP
jgi:hypothetical protein